MFLAVRDTKVTAIHETEWECRRKAMGITRSEYINWLETVTTEDGLDVSGLDYEIHPANFNITDFIESGHIVSDDVKTHYFLTWDGRDVHADDDALAAYKIAEKWKQIRKDRDQLLDQTDWIVTKATETDTSVSTDWKTYRQALRDVPSQSDPDNITWPERPE